MTSSRLTQFNAIFEAVRAAHIAVDAALAAAKFIESIEETEALIRSAVISVASGEAADLAIRAALAAEHAFMEDVPIEVAENVAAVAWSAAKCGASPEEVAEWRLAEHRKAA